MRDACFRHPVAFKLIRPKGRCEYPRTYSLGYRISEIIPKKEPEISEGVKIRAHVRDNKRAAVARSLGCHVDGYALPVPDLKDPDTVIHGAKCRYLKKNPPLKEHHVKRLRDFVWVWLRQNLEPLAPGTFPVDRFDRVDEWLETTHYPLWRKEELRKIWRENQDGVINRKTTRNKSFIKHESYPCYKPARTINSRTDYFKCYSGPYMKKMEEMLFKLPCFVKHIPVSTRPLYIKERLHRPSGKYYMTDYSAFESHFTAQLLKIIEFQLYKYMLKNYPIAGSKICQAIGGTNVCGYQNLTIKVPAKRMSGEMSTSLANGFTNMILTEYLAHIHDSKIAGVFEGDDGLFRVDGEWEPKSEDYADLGFTIKMASTSDFSESNFCGMLADEQDLENVTDIVGSVLSFGWTMSAQMHSGPGVCRGLLKAKALSLLYEHPACPVLTAMASRYYSLLKHEKERFGVGWYDIMLQQRDMIDIRTRVHEPSIRTRRLVERLFGISIADQQHLEEYFSRISLDQPMNDPVLLDHCSRYSADPKSGVDLSDYFSRYVVNVPAGSAMSVPF